MTVLGPKFTLSSWGVYGLIRLFINGQVLL